MRICSQFEFEKRPMAFDANDFTSVLKQGSEMTPILRVQQVGKKCH